MKRKVLIFAAAALAMVAAVGLGTGKASAQSAPPVANPGGPYTGAVGQLIQVNGAASTGFNLSFLWNWGDGTASPGPVFSHAYNAANTYTIPLTVTDGLGRTSSAATTAVITGITQNVFAPAFQPSIFGFPFGFGGFGFNTGVFANNCVNTFAGIVCGSGFTGVSPFLGGGCNTVVLGNGTVACTPVAVGGVTGSRQFIPGVGWVICQSVNGVQISCQQTGR